MESIAQAGSTKCKSKDHDGIQAHTSLGSDDGNTEDDTPAGFALGPPTANPTRSIFYSPKESIAQAGSIKCKSKDQDGIQAHTSRGPDDKNTEDDTPAGFALGPSTASPTRAIHIRKLRNRAVSKQELLDLKNQQLARTAIETEREIHIRFLNGVGGRYKELWHFFALFDLPLSQVKFLNDYTLEITDHFSLQAGNRYTAVIAPTKVPDDYTALECLCCGDSFRLVPQSTVHCATCDLQETCLKCLVIAQQSWIDHMCAVYEWRELKVGAKVCTLCLYDLPDAISNYNDPASALFWRMRIVRFRFNDDIDEL